MFNWKIAATIFVTLGILVVVLASSPQMGGFIDTLRGKVSDIVPEQNIARNISFSLISDEANVTGSAKDVNIEIRTDRFSAQLRDINLSSRGTIRILGFSGFLSADKKMAIDGTFKKLELEGTTLSPSQGSVKSEASYDKLVIDGLAVKEIVVHRGKLTINNATTDSQSEIILSHPMGRFEFDDDRLVIDGNANKISIPDAKIFVG